MTDAEGEASVDPTVRRRRRLRLGFFGFGCAPLLLSTCCSSLGLGWVRWVDHMYGYPGPTYSYTDVYAPGSVWQSADPPHVHVSFSPERYPSTSSLLPLRTCEIGSPYAVTVRFDDPSGTLTHVRCETIEIIDVDLVRRLPLTPSAVAPPTQDGWAALYRNNPLPGYADWEIAFRSGAPIDVPPRRALRVRFRFTTRHRDGRERNYDIDGPVEYRCFERSEFLIPID